MSIVSSEKQEEPLELSTKDLKRSGNNKEQHEHKDNRNHDSERNTKNTKENEMVEL